MTTAHRPTFRAAVASFGETAWGSGHEEQGGMRLFAPSQQVSAKNLPGHTQLKFRQEGQASGSERHARDLRAELEEKERKHFLKTKSTNFEEEREEDLKLLQAAPPAAAGDGGGGAQPRQLVPRAIDADEGDDEDEESSDDSDDDEDDEAELLAELERIKRERAEEAARKAAEEAAKAEQEERAQMAGGNPLLQERLGAGGDFAIKRRWDDDVVFRNQARGEPKAQKRFINDTIRNDFHKRFLDRYMK